MVPVSVDADTDHDLDADSAHDEPARSVEEHQIREIWHVLRSLARLQREAAEREVGRDARDEAKDAVLLRLTEAVERLASDPGVIRVVVERGSGLLERALVPDVLAGLAKLMVAGAFLAAALTGLQVSGFGVTISAIAEQAMRPDTGTAPTP